jgi:hypothetical protein
VSKSTEGLCQMHADRPRRGRGDVQRREAHRDALMRPAVGLLVPGESVATTLRPAAFAASGGPVSASVEARRCKDAFAGPSTVAR